MNFPSVSQFSIAKGTSGTNPPEMYIPLWWYSGQYALNASAPTLSGATFALKGTNTAGVSNNSSEQLHTLNANWNPNLKYAFEASLQASGGDGTTYAALWDITSNAIVSASQISQGALATFGVFRSGQFTLTPGHVYGVTMWGATSGSAYVTDASLIVFPS